MAGPVLSPLSPPSATEALLHEDPVIHGRRWFLLGIMCLSLVMVVMSVSGLNVAIPSIQRELGSSASALQWIVDSYALVFAALLLPAGALGDRFGRKRALLLGLFIFATGSAVSGIGTSSGQVIFGRVITGIGAAFVMPATLSLLTTIFPPQERRRAIAVWAGFAGAGGAIGPIVSGALLERYWWGSALLVNVPVVLGVIAAVWIFSPTSRDPEATPLDPLGSLLSLIGLGALVFAIIEGPERGWSDEVVVTSFALAAAALAAFLAWERNTAHPMLPLRLFRDRRMSVGSGVITIAFFVMLGLFFLFTMYLQFVRGYSPLAAGLAERLGSGPMMSLGFLLIGAGFGILAFVGPGTSYLMLALSLVLLGAGMSLTAAPATGNIMSAVPPAKAGVGSAVNDTTREVGGALGIAVLGSIASATYRSAVDLDGLSLPPPVAEAAHESIGAAATIASDLPGGAALAARAGSAFTDAFNMTSGVAAVVAFVAAGVVIAVFSRRSEDAAAAGDEAFPPWPVEEQAPEPAHPPAPAPAPARAPAPAPAFEPR